MLERTVDQDMMFVLVAVPKGVLAARPRHIFIHLKRVVKDNNKTKKVQAETQSLTACLALCRRSMRGLDLKD